MVRWGQFLRLFFTLSLSLPWKDMLCDLLLTARQPAVNKDSHNLVWPFPIRGTTERLEEYYKEHGKRRLKWCRIVAARRPCHPLCCGHLITFLMVINLSKKMTLSRRVHHIAHTQMRTSAHTHSRARVSCQCFTPGCRNLW